MGTIGGKFEYEEPVEKQEQEVIVSESESEADSVEVKKDEQERYEIIYYLVGTTFYLLTLLVLRDTLEIDPLIPTAVCGVYIWVKTTSPMSIYKNIRSFFVTEVPEKPTESLMVVEWVADNAEESPFTEFTVESVTNNLLELIYSEDSKGKLNMRFRDSRTRTLRLNA